MLRRPLFQASANIVFGLSCLLASCKQAGYQVLQPMSEPVTPSGFAGDGKVPPTARVEVLDRGIPVTWTVVGQKVAIRPSLDTVDPDFVGKSSCDNPGIQSAKYQTEQTGEPVESGTTLLGTISRTVCKSLKLEDYVFQKAGTYVIKMEVVSEDLQVGWASVTLKVLEKGVTRDQIEGGFTVHAKPILAGVDSPVEFTGICELKGQLTISWDFGDTSSADGLVSTHSYKSPGQYRVNAVCKSHTGKSLQASLTVVIMRGVLPSIPDGLIVVPSQNPSIPPANKPNCDPSQGPCQDGVSQTPSQTSKVPTTTAPTKKPVIWYYDPYCGCYYHY